MVVIACVVCLCIILVACFASAVVVVLAGAYACASPGMAAALDRRGGAPPKDAHEPAGRTERRDVRYAWVTLVMLGDSYVPGALVTGHSLRTVKTRHATACMVTPDVSASAREALGHVFDEVLEVPYIEHRAKPLKSEKQQAMYAWMDKSFTKWNCLGFAQWARVVFCDADTCFVRNADDLFDLHAPAGCFSNPWAKPYAPQGFANPYLADYRRTAGRPHAHDIPHGARIPAALALASLNEPTFTVLGAMILVETGSAQLEAFKALVTAAPVYGADHAIVGNTAEEVAIVELTTKAGKDWTHIHQRYEAVPRKPAWLGYKSFEEMEKDPEIRCWHFLGTKTWIMSPDEWPDLRPWWDEADRMAAATPELRKYVERVAPAANGNAPDTEAAQLDAELAQLQLTRDLQNFLYGKLRHHTDHHKYEADNILERWLIALVNARGSGLYDLVPWAAVYMKLKPGDTPNQKMADELVEKKIAPSRADANSIVSRVVQTVNQRLSVTPTTTGADATCVAVATPTEITYGSRFRTEMTPRLKTLVGRYACGLVLRLAMRYATVLNRGQQWGLPQAHFDELYDRLGVRHEAFASPLNSRLLGKEGADFCSLFPDTDAVFGSQGDFFGVDMLARGLNWQVNPPFIVSLLDRAAAKAVAALLVALKNKQSLKVFFLMPAWTDTTCYEILSQSAAAAGFLAHEGRLRRDQYSLEQPDGKPITARFDCLYFALVTPPPTDAEKRTIIDIISRAGSRRR